MDVALVPEYEKVIIEINMSNSTFLNNTDCDFYFDIMDSVRNVMYIKLVKLCIAIKPNSKVDSIFKYNDGDSIYVAINDYNRVSAIVNNSIDRFFETIDVNLTQMASVIGSRTDQNISVLYTRDYSPLFDKNDVSVYKLKPADPNLKRFNIKLYDKNGQKLKKTDVDNFKISLCIYSTNKKFDGSS